MQKLAKCNHIKNSLSVSPLHLQLVTAPSWTRPLLGTWMRRPRSVPGSPRSGLRAGLDSCRPLPGTSRRGWPEALESDWSVGRAHPGPSPGVWWLGSRRVLGRTSGSSALNCLTSLFPSGCFDLGTSQAHRGWSTGWIS